MMHRDASTVLLVIATSNSCGISIEALEKTCALGDVEEGAFFRNCLFELTEFGLVDVYDGIARLSAYRNSPTDSPVTYKKLKKGLSALEGRS